MHVWWGAQLPGANRARTHTQVEGVHLSSDSTVKALEAELAGVKKSLAGLEATFKAEKASWGAELENARFDVRAHRMHVQLHQHTHWRGRGERRQNVAEPGGGTNTCILVWGE